ncbi:MAG: ribonuclease P protein component [Hyphomonadaceae bacterium]|nr:ribonuclease P protein component [Hyphomonadaceae bacterium]
MTQKSVQKLTKRAQFLFVRQGERAGRGHVLVEARRRAEDGPIGLGLTASKKVGNAVARNRARRRLREAARQLLPIHGLAGVDYVLVARQSTPEADWGALLDDLKNALIRLASALNGASARPQSAQKQDKPLHKRPTESD